MIKLRLLALVVLNLSMVMPSLSQSKPFSFKDINVKNDTESSDETQTRSDSDPISTDGWGEDDFKVYNQKLQGIPSRVNGTIESYVPREHYADITSSNQNLSIEDRYEGNIYNDALSYATDLRQYVNDTIFTSNTTDLRSDYQFRIDDASMPFEHTNIQEEDTVDYYLLSLYGQACIEINLKVPEYRDFKLELYKSAIPYYYYGYPTTELIDSCDCKVLDERIRVDNCCAGDYFVKIIREENLTSAPTNNTSCYSLLINVDYECNQTVNLKQLENECNAYASLYVADFTNFYRYVQQINSYVPSGNIMYMMPWMEYDGSLFFRENAYAEYVNGDIINNFAAAMPLSNIRGVGELSSTSGVYHQASIYLSNKFTVAAFKATMQSGQEVLSDTTTSLNEKVAILKSTLFRNSAITAATSLINSLSNTQTRPTVLWSIMSDFIEGGFNIAKSILVSACRPLDHENSQYGYLRSDSEQRSINKVLSDMQSCLFRCNQVLNSTTDKTLEIRFDYVIATSLLSLNYQTAQKYNVIDGTQISSNQNGNPYFGHVLPLNTDDFEEQLLTTFCYTAADYSADDEPSAADIELEDIERIKLDSYRTTWYCFTSYNSEGDYDITLTCNTGKNADIKFVDEEMVGYRRAATISTIEYEEDSVTTAARNLNWTTSANGLTKTATVHLEEDEELYIKINPANYAVDNSNNYFATDATLMIKVHEVLPSTMVIYAEDIREAQSNNDPYSEYSTTITSENDEQEVSIYSDRCKSVLDQYDCTYFLVSGKSWGVDTAYLEMEFALPISAISFDMGIWSGNGDSIIKQYAIHIIGKEDGTTILDRKVYCQDMGRTTDGLDTYSYNFNTPIDTLAIIIEPQIPQYNSNTSGNKGRVFFNQFILTY